MPYVAPTTAIGGLYSERIFSFPISLRFLARLQVFSCFQKNHVDAVRRGEAAPGNLPPEALKRPHRAPLCHRQMTSNRRSANRLHAPNAFVCELFSNKKSPANAGQ
jgi:hypothetical protein